MSIFRQANEKSYCSLHEGEIKQEEKKRENIKR